MRLQTPTVAFQVT